MEEKLFYQTIFAGIFLWFLIHNASYLLEQKSQTTKEFVQPNLKYLLKEELIEEIKEEQELKKQELEQNPRVLVPVVIYGPNNQYQGFREAIVIAKILNRKIAIPPFCKHYSVGGTYMIPSGEIFDLDSIYSLAQVAEKADVAESCPDHRFELIFNTHKTWKDQTNIKMTYNWFNLMYETFENTAKVDLVNPKNDFQKDISNQFSGFDSINCVMLKQPFGIINWNRLAHDRLQASELYDYEFISMILEVIRSTRRSQKIQKISQDFLESKSVTHFAALHWRYDLKDWLHLNNGEGENIRKIKSIREDPTEFSKKVLEEMKKIEATTIILFSPPADYPFLQNLTDSLQKIQPTVQIIQEKEISDFAKSASRLEEGYFATQLSLISQELAFSSDFYFYSNPSTWSANVVLERLAANVFGERMILDFV